MQTRSISPENFPVKRKGWNGDSRPDAPVNTANATYAARDLGQMENGPYPHQSERFLPWLKLKDGPFSTSGYTY